MVDHREIFKRQLDRSERLTKDQVDAARGRCFNGERYMVGDKILYFLIRRGADVELVTIVERILGALNAYEFVGYSGSFPLYAGSQ